MIGASDLTGMMAMMPAFATDEAALPRIFVRRTALFQDGERELPS